MRAGAVEAASQPYRRSRRAALRPHVEGYLLISPWLIGLIVFTIGPIVTAFVLSFMRWDLVGSPTFIGLANYERAFGGDRLFNQAVVNTLIYVSGSVPLTIMLSLTLALLLNGRVVARSAWVAIFYIPSIFSIVAMAVLWRWIFNPQAGLLNDFLARIGIDGPPWLGSADWSRPALIIVSAMYVGPQMLIFLAGLKSIPKELYESASIDGAGTWSQFRHVTLPMLSATMLFVIVTAVIHAFQVLALVYVMFAGESSAGPHGPLNSTLVYALYIYEQAFQQLNMGYASALSWLLFAAVMVVTLLLLRSSSRWVFYAR